MILGGGVAVGLFLSAHRAVIFAIAQLSRLDIAPSLFLSSQNDVG